MCQNYKFGTGCTYGNKCFFRHVEADEKPNKRSKEGGAKGSVALLKESIQLGCVSQDSHPRKSTLRKEGKHDLGLFVTVQFLEDTLAVLPHGKLFEEHGHSYEWASSQKQRLI